MIRLTVVIPTWRRPTILSQVLAALSIQTLPMQQWEVIVVDSMSGDETPDVVSNAAAKSKLNLRIVNAEINSASVKRNVGFALAKGKFVIFLDDDCIPEPGYLDAFLMRAEVSAGKRVVWCGGVKFDQHLVDASNYYRYRSSCHFAKGKPTPAKLEFQAVVTMNMLVERQMMLADNLRFDERFIGYGFEDIQFGAALESKGYKLLACDADIVHQEPVGDILKFRKKFFHAGRDGMPVFREVSPQYIRRLGQTSWLEPADPDDGFFHGLFRSIIHLILDSRIPAVLATALLRFDRVPLLYSRIAYRITLAGAYRDGVRARTGIRVMNADRANKAGWYS